MARWQTASSGVRYRNHKTRKHGVTPDRYYLIHYKIDGERIQEALGWLSEGWTLKKVQYTLNDLKASAKNGGPRTLKEIRAKQESDNAQALTFADVLEEIWKVELINKRSGADTKKLLIRNVIPEWGNRRLDTIKRRDIVLLLDEINKRAPVTRNRVHSALSRLFNFAAERGIIEDSPCTRIKKVHEESKERFLSDQEIELFWEALDPDNRLFDAYFLTKIALKLILVTGQRPGEVAGMKWSEIEENLWTIPAERMKTKKAHTVILPSLALELIEQAGSISSDSKYVFKSSHKDGDQPIDTQAVSRAVLKHWNKTGIKEKFTPHDLRRTVRTKLAELGVDDIIAERMLGHQLQGMMKIYNQHDYLKEKGLAFNKWDRRLREITGMVVNEPAKVINISGGK